MEGYSILEGIRGGRILAKLTERQSARIDYQSYALERVRDIES